MTKDEALTLEALKYAASLGNGRIVQEMNAAPFIIRCDEALAQPAQQQPVPWSQALEDAWAEPDEVFPPAQQEPSDLDVWRARALQAEAVIEKFMDNSHDSNKPVAWINPDEQNARKAFHWVKSEEFTSPVYTSPPAQRTWLGLTDEERDDLLGTYITADGRAQAIEAKLKEKNT